MNKSKRLIANISTSVPKKKLDIKSSKDTGNEAPNEHTRRRTPIARTVRNFLLVWVDSRIDKLNDDVHNIITELQRVVNTVDTFTDLDEFIDFVSDIDENEVFLILSEEFARTIIPIVHQMSQVTCVYIFCENNTQDEHWTDRWDKVKGVFTNITPICEALKLTSQDGDQNAFSISFVATNDGTSNKNLDQLDPSFMYTEIIKEILLNIDFKRQHIDEFFMYCRKQFVGNSIELRNVDKVEREYHNNTPIWWYTGQSFLYSMLNRAIRTMDAQIIIKIGFFIRDLHHHIAHLHSEQYFGSSHSGPFTVYRGQGLFCEDFERLIKTKGGLISFNNFLSTSKNRDVSFVFAEANTTDPGIVGILFVMEINPSTSSTPFADTRDVSVFEGEEEMLFSMHSVFRINDIKPLGNNNRLCQVNLTLTSDNDPELHALTKHIRNETFPHKEGWYRLGGLLIKLAEFDQAQQVFEIMLDQTSDEHEKANIYHMLGIVKYGEGEYEKAVRFYEKSIEINKKILPPTHPDLIASYTNIGIVYEKMVKYSKTCSFDEKPIEIYQTTVASNHPTFSISDGNIDLMNDNMDDYSKAFASFEKGLQVLQQTFSADHRSLATFYDRYGSVYEKLGDHQKALLLYQRALEIKQKILVSNHPDLATSFANHGAVYEKMGNLPTARSFYQRAYNIGQRALPANHPDLQVYRHKVENEINQS
jgi:tetratricopeptide (TPR) repeat protein